MLFAKSLLCEVIFSSVFTNSFLVFQSLFGQLMRRSVQRSAPLLLLSVFLLYVKQFSRLLSTSIFVVSQSNYQFWTSIFFFWFLGTPLDVLDPIFFFVFLWCLHSSVTVSRKTAVLVESLVCSLLSLSWMPSSCITFFLLCLVCVWMTRRSILLCVVQICLSCSIVARTLQHHTSLTK